MQFERYNATSPVRLCERRPIVIVGASFAALPPIRIKPNSYGFIAPEAQSQ